MPQEQHRGNKATAHKPQFFLLEFQKWENFCKNPGLNQNNCSSLLLISTSATSDQVAFKNQQNRAEATNAGKLNQETHLQVPTLTAPALTIPLEALLHLS